MESKRKRTQRSKREKRKFFTTVARGAGIIGGKVASGVKKVATAENAGKLGNWDSNVGDFMESRSFGYEPPKKRTTKKKVKKKRR